MGVRAGPTMPFTPVLFVREKPARRVRHVPVWLYTYTSEVGIESDLALVGIRTWHHSIDVAAHGFFVGL